MKKLKFKILCGSEEVCPEVKKVLEDMGFTDFKDLRNSPSFDIAAKFELENEKEEGHARKISDEIFKKCKEKVQTIQITS